MRVVSSHLIFTRNKASTLADVVIIYPTRPKRIAPSASAADSIDCHYDTVVISSRLR